MEENKKLKDHLEFIENAISRTCGHSYDLVWYARSNPIA